MATHRSPNCPQISFSEAVEKGRKVYAKEHTHPAPKAAVAEDLGYSSMSGRALSIIGALRQYGILEGPGEAMRITEDAVVFYELEDGTERNEALRRMIFAPPFFESLRQQFGESLPSESTLKHHLIKEGFLPKAADEVISVYRENIELVKNMPKRYTETVLVPEQPPMAAAPIPVAYSAAPALPPSTPAGGVLSYSFPLSMEATADLHIRGKVSIDELDMLRDHIELTIKALKRKQVAPTSQPEVPSGDAG